MAKVLLEVEKWSPTDDEHALVLMTRLVNGVRKYRIPTGELLDDLRELVQRVYSIGCRDMLEIIEDEDGERATKMAGAREVIRKELVDEIIAMLMDSEQRRLRKSNLNLPIPTPLVDEP